MTTFEYRGLTEAGRTRRGLIEALDPKEAREKLAHSGVLAERLAPAGESRRKGWALRRRSAFPLEARAMVYQELASLTGAGLPLVQALDILINSPELGPSRTVLARVRDAIREGTPLATALTDADPQVTPFERAVVEVGERTGELDTVLNRLADFLEEQKSMQERVATALLYPVLVFSLALLIALGVLGFMVPKVGTLLQESDIKMPALTSFMMWLSSLVSSLLIPGLLILLLVGFLVRRRYRDDERLRLQVNRWQFALPVLGVAYTALVNLRFSRTLALLLRGGVPLVDGVGMAGRATGSEWVTTLVDRESDQVRQGRSLADAIRRVPPLRASLPGWIDAGEASGDLAGLLESAAARYQRQWSRLIGRFLTLLEPALVLAIGIFVLLVALSILLPVLSMNKQLM